MLCGTVTRCHPVVNDAGVEVDGAVIPADAGGGRHGGLGAGRRRTRDCRWRIEIL